MTYILYIRSNYRLKKHWSGVSAKKFNSLIQELLDSGYKLTDDYYLMVSRYAIVERSYYEKNKTD